MSNPPNHAFESACFQILTTFISHGPSVIKSSVAYAWAQRIFPVSGEHHRSLAGSLDNHFHASHEQIRSLARLLEEDMEQENQSWSSYEDVAKNTKVSSIFPNMQWGDRKSLIRGILDVYLLDLIEDQDHDTTHHSIAYLAGLLRRQNPSFTKADAAQSLFQA